MQLRKSFYEVAEDDPAMATIMFYAALKRLGGTLRLSREELETFNCVSTSTLVAGILTEEGPDIAHVEWKASEGDA